MLHWKTMSGIWALKSDFRKETDHPKGFINFVKGAFVIHKMRPRNPPPPSFAERSLSRARPPVKAPAPAAAAASIFIFQMKKNYFQSKALIRQFISFRKKLISFYFLGWMHIMRELFLWVTEEGLVPGRGEATLNRRFGSTAAKEAPVFYENSRDKARSADDRFRHWQHYMPLLSHLSSKNIKRLG